MYLSLTVFLIIYLKMYTNLHYTLTSIEANHHSICWSYSNCCYVWIVIYSTVINVKLHVPAVQLLQFIIKIFRILEVYTVKDHACIFFFRRLSYAKILPPSCFDVDGMVLKPQLRTALHVLGYQMYEEEFDKVWDR